MPTGDLRLHFVILTVFVFYVYVIYYLDNFVNKRAAFAINLQFWVMCVTWVRYEGSDGQGVGGTNHLSKP